MAQHREMPAKQLYLRLKEEGILVRYFDMPRINNFLRVTVGTMDDMEIFIKTLEKILA